MRKFCGKLKLGFRWKVVKTISGEVMGKLVLIGAKLKLNKNLLQEILQWKLFIW